jgi:hypothetical protein
MEARRKTRTWPVWLRNTATALLVAAGSVLILMPAWLPDKPSFPVEGGVVETLQILLLLAATAVAIGGIRHAGRFRPICRVFALGLAAASLGELEDVLGMLVGKRFPMVWLIGPLLAAALFTLLRHRAATGLFFSSLMRHAGTGMIAAALLILYVFNGVFASRAFWKAALEEAYTPEIPTICGAYLELLACYFIFVGTVGLVLLFVRRLLPGER